MKRKVWGKAGVCHPEIKIRTILNSNLKRDVGLSTAASSSSSALLIEDPRSLRRFVSEPGTCCSAPLMLFEAALGVSGSVRLGDIIMLKLIDVLIRLAEVQIKK